MLGDYLSTRSFGVHKDAHLLPFLFTTVICESTRGKAIHMSIAVSLSFLALLSSNEAARKIYFQAFPGVRRRLKCCIVEVGELW